MKIPNGNTCIIHKTIVSQVDIHAMEITRTGKKENQFHNMVILNLHPIFSYYLTENFYNVFAGSIVGFQVNRKMMLGEGRKSKKK